MGAAPGTCDKLRVRDLKLSLLATCAMLALPAASGLLW